MEKESKPIKINELTIIEKEKLEWLNYFAPHIILPEKTADFFLLHRNHLIMSKELNIIAISSIWGKLEELQKIEPHLEEFAKRTESIRDAFIGNILRPILSSIQDISKEISTSTGVEKISSTLIEKMSKIFRMEQIFKALLPFVQNLQISLGGYLSKYLLDETRKLMKGLGLSYSESTLEPFKFIEELTLMLWRSNVIFLVFFINTCTNPTITHYDFSLLNVPLKEEKCRICGYPIITFRMYLIKEPYAYLKSNHRDLSFVIASYLSTKSAGLIECYPEVYVQKDSRQEEIDVFIRNWVTGTIAIAECKVHENPLPTYETKVNMITQDLQQLIRKINHVNAKFGYLITNLHFENDEEVNRVLEDAKNKLKDNLSNVKLIGKVKGKNVITEWDSILSDLKQS